MSEPQNDAGSKKLPLTDRLVEWAAEHKESIPVDIGVRELLKEQMEQIEPDLAKEIDGHMGKVDLPRILFCS
jgi:hypothetical protein